MLMLELFKDWEDKIEYPKKTVVFHEGDPAEVMYVLLKGEIEVLLKGEPLGAELPGGIIGEMAMINANFRSATVQTLKKSVLARIDRDQFREMISKNPDFALHIMSVLANRLRVANMQIVG